MRRVGICRGVFTRPGLAQPVFKYLPLQALARSIAARESQVHLLRRANTGLQAAHSKAQSAMVDLCWELRKLLDQASKRTAMQQHVALERLFQRFSTSKDPPSISAYADEVSQSNRSMPMND